jgi:hypothetical protein
VEVGRKTRTRAPDAFPERTPEAASSATMHCGLGICRSSVPLNKGRDMAARLQVRRSDEILRNGQARSAKTHFSKGARGGSDYSPALRAGKSDDVTNVLNFEAFDFAVFGFVIAMRE